MSAERFRGIHASAVLPMLADGAIDEAAFTAHLLAVLDGTGLRGLLVNGHAGEGALLAPSEARRVVVMARGVAGNDVVVVAGVSAEGSAAAAELARDAEAAGADAIMVFAPFSWAPGADPRAVLRHHRAIHDATDLPLFLFQGSVRSGGLHFPEHLLRELLQLPRVAGIKEGSWETAAYDATRTLAARERPDVLVMASGDEHLFPCFAIGSGGSLVSLAAIVPELVVALDVAVRRGDLAEARALHARITPLARAVYGAPPPGLATARLKHCLHLLGRIPSPRCRAPLEELEAPEIAALCDALRSAGLSL